MSLYVAKEHEKFVNNTVLFIEDVATGEHIYHDADLKVEVSRAEMVEILKRGPVILYCDDDSTFVTPTVWVDGGENSYVTGKIVTMVSSAATELLFYTKEQE